MLKDFYDVSEVVREGGCEVISTFELIVNLKISLAKGAHKNFRIISMYYSIQ